LRHWRATLDAWTKDPFTLADRLDTACKMKIIDHELRRAGIGWNDLNDGLKVLGGLRQRYPARLMRAVLTDDSNRLSAEESSQFAAARATVRTHHRDRSELLRFVARLQALDLNYHELGGLHDTLETAGRVRGVVVDPADIDRRSEERRVGRGGRWQGLSGRG